MGSDWFWIPFGIFICGMLLGSIMLFPSLPVAEEQPVWTQIEPLGDAFSNQRVYEVEGYNCVNFSEDFVKLVEDQTNISLKMVKGCTTDNTQCHRWVKLDYEPQHNQIVDYSTEYPVQEVVK